MRSIFSSSTSQTATHWTGTALRALLSTPQKPTAQLAWLVGGDLPVMRAAQQQQQPPHGPHAGRAPACHLQTCAAKHISAMAFDRAAALAKREEGISGSAALEQQRLATDHPNAVLPIRTRTQQVLG